MPRLSIVIPVVGDPQQLDDTLVSVLESRPANCEVVVVHNQSYHDPYNLSDEVRFVEARRGAGWGECANCGVAASQSPIVNVLTCGVEVHAGWSDVAMRHFRDPSIAAVAAVVVDRDNRDRVISAGLGYRAEGAAWRLGYRQTVDQAVANQQDLCGPDPLVAFYRKSVLDLLGGFSSWAGAAMAGVDLGLALREAKCRSVVEPQCLAHAAASLHRMGSAFHHGRYAERVFWHWASAQGLCTSLLGHFAMFAGQCVMALWRPTMLLQLLGRGLGLLESMFAKRPKAADTVEMPSVVPSPHFTHARCADKRPTSRVA